MKPVFEYRQYKAYLKDRLELRGRGEKSRLAEALRCQLAYVSQVLNAQAQFSPEQADTVNRHLAHSEEEAEFFLCLVLEARAGTASLQAYYRKRVDEMIRARLSLERRLGAKTSLPGESQAIYYSAWYYAAIHLLVTIPAFQTRDAIARHLGMPIQRVSEVLDFLVASGLAEVEHGRYRAGQVTLHLPKDSPWLARHHSNWRMRSVQALDRTDADPFHYTSVVSMAPEDAPRVREILLEAIEKVRAVVKPSAEKAAYCYALDFFGV